MALTAYCKKCGKEVDAGEICPYCGSRLGKTSAHAVWCVEITPVRDWMSWNAVMRILLPTGLAALILILLLEGISGGTEAVERLLGSGLLATLGILLATALAVTLLILWLQGKELSDFVVDSRGIHETRYLPHPTRLKLIARLKSPGRMDAAAGAEQVVKLSERDLPWKNVARVQLWPEKCMILFYAPGWWLRIPVVCTPFSWEDTAGMIRGKLGKKKKVKPPPSRAQPAPAGSVRAAGRPEPFAEQLRMDDADLFGPEEPLPAGEPGTADMPADSGGDEPDA